MSLITIPASVLLALVMGATAVRKVRPDEASVVLRDRLGVRADVWALVGIPEALVAVGLIAGLAWTPVGVAAAVGGALIMAGAFILHVRVGFLGAALVPPTVVLALAALAATALLVAS